MTDWLLAHQESVQANLFFGTVAVVLILEAFLPRRVLATSAGNRWLNHVALAALGSLLARLCLPFAAFAMAVLAEQQGWGLLNHLALPVWLACALGVLAMDVGGYALHRAMHAVPILWRFHRIHHSDLDMDCGTTFRHHPAESLASAAFGLAVICTVGVSPLAAMIATTFAGIASAFNHGNVALPPVADRILRWLVVTPDMHRIHHSTLVRESNRNFANLFSWWDRLFATYQREPEHGHDRMKLGLEELRDPGDVTLWKLLVLPSRPADAPMLPGMRLSGTEPSP